MDSFKSGSGILSVINLVIEVSLAIYIVNSLSNVRTDQSSLKNDLGMLGKKIVEVDSKNLQITSIINDITKTVSNFKNTRNELIASVNELHQFKASTEERLELIETTLDLIISTLDENKIVIPVAKPKPKSRFGRQHQMVDNTDHKVGFKSPIASQKTIDDDGDEDEDLVALNAYRKSKR